MIRIHTFSLMLGSFGLPSCASCLYSIQLASMTPLSACKVLLFGWLSTKTARSHTDLKKLNRKMPKSLDLNRRLTRTIFQNSSEANRTGVYATQKRNFCCPIKMISHQRKTESFLNPFTETADSASALPDVLYIYI